MNAGRRAGVLAASATPDRATPLTWNDDLRAQVLIVLIWIAVVLPQIIQSLTTLKHQASIEVDAVPLTHVARLARTTLTLTLAAVALWFALSAARRASSLRLMPLVIFLAPWVLMVIRDWHVSGRPSKQALLLPVLTIAFWVLRPRIRSLAVLGYLTAIGAAISIAMAIVEPSSAIFRSAQEEVVTTDKQILPWGMLAGFLTQPNSLGKFLVLGLPAVLLIPRLRHRVAAVSLCVFALVWSASRTSLDSAAVMTATAIVLALVPTPPMKRWAGTLAVIVAMGAVCVLPFLHTAPTAFTNRSFIWQASLPYWHANPWFGQGSDWYQRIATTSAAIAGAAFYAHNQLVQFLVTGGLCYAITAGALLWLAATYASRQVLFGSRFGVLFLVTLAGTFTLEVSFPTVDNTTMLPVALAPLAIVVFSRDNRSHYPETSDDGDGEVNRADSPPQDRSASRHTTHSSYSAEDRVVEGGTRDHAYR